MGIRQILQFPDPRLRKKAAPIEHIADDILKLADDMFATMYDAPGIGLAATQINVQKHIAVIDISQEKSSPLIFINAKITMKQGEREYEEGCLSIPEARGVIKRADTLHIKALDIDGKTFELDADGLLATCIQHEMDHLNGQLFIDHLSNLKRQRIQKRAGKRRKQK